MESLVFIRNTRHWKQPYCNSSKIIFDDSGPGNYAIHYRATHSIEKYFN